MFQTDDFYIDEDFLNCTFESCDELPVNKHQPAFGEPQLSKRTKTSPINDQRTTANANTISTDSNLPLQLPVCDKNVKTPIKEYSANKKPVAGESVACTVQAFSNSITKSSNIVETDKQKLPKLETSNLRKDSNAAHTNKSPFNNKIKKPDHIKFLDTTTKKFIKPKVVQRKFPGPAGILPDRKDARCLKNIKDCARPDQKEQKSGDEILCSQLSVSAFSDMPWMRMLSDFDRNDSGINLIEKYTIAWIKSRASSKQLISQKAPFLAAVITSVNTINENPILLLKDLSGEIQGSVESELWEEHGEALQPGSVIVLVQVGILTTLTSIKRHYLNITANNLALIYNSVDSNSQKENKVDVIRLKDYTYVSIIKIIADVKTKYKVNRITNCFMQNTTSNASFAQNFEQKCENKNQVKNYSFVNVQNKFNTDRNNENVNITTMQNDLVKKTPSKFKFVTKGRTASFNIPNDGKMSSATCNQANETKIEELLDGIDTDSLFSEF